MQKLVVEVFTPLIIIMGCMAIPLLLSMIAYKSGNLKYLIVVETLAFVLSMFCTVVAIAWAWIVFISK